MLEGVVSLLGEYGNLLPRFTSPRCLLTRQAVGGCDACAQSCPHEAISLHSGVEIDPGRCTGCGLCTQSCPTGALEYDLLPTLRAVREQGQRQAPIACSQSGAGGETLPCLGRVTAAAVVAAGGWDVPLTLLHGECHDCALGGSEVPQRLAEVVGEAQRLRAVTGRPTQVTVRQAKAGEGVGQQVSRRGLFGALARQAREAVSRSIPESPLPFVDWSVPEERRPAEWLWRKRALRPAPDPQAALPWPAPHVLPGCIDCPVCANVCPTSAITRSLDEGGNLTLQLDLQACTSCGACARSCPPQVIELRSDYAEAEFAAPVTLRRKEG